jgi:hypothetical protein
MATPPDNPPTTELPVSPRRFTWLPILVGVLCGFVICCVFSNAACDFIAAACPGPFVGRRPTCYGIYFKLYVYATIAGGGSIGVLFSAWHKTKAFLFLLAFLIVFAAFDVLGRYLDTIR